MKIEFKKVSFNSSTINYLQNDLKFDGIFEKTDQKTVKCRGKFSGFISHICDRCAKEFSLPFDEEIELRIVDGITEQKDEDFFNTIECIDSIIDFDEIIKSEIELYKNEYHYCEKCKQQGE
jgi:uncharacterized metal-binding protein YceD (DUF177 family)